MESFLGVFDLDDVDLEEKNNLGIVNLNEFDEEVYKFKELLEV